MAMVILQFPDHKRVAIEANQIVALCELMVPEYMGQKDVPALEICFFNGVKYLIPDKENTLLDFLLSKKDEWAAQGGDNTIILK